jgi:hypothetical protein
MIGTQLRNPLAQNILSRHSTDHERCKLDRHQWVFGHFGRPERRESLHFSTCTAPACQAIGTHLCARQRRRTPMIHRGRAAQQISSAGRWEQIEQVAGRDVGDAGQNHAGSPGGRRHPGIEGSPKLTFRSHLTTDDFRRPITCHPCRVGGVAVGGTEIRFEVRA